jgi:Photosynthetic reaction centre cytochrome C subunit
MRRLAAALVLVMMFGAVVKFTVSLSPPEAMAQPPSSSQPSGRPGAPPPMAMMSVDSFVAERDSMTKIVLQDIAGKENAPAESVFKNIKLMKGVPAERVLRTMNAFGHSLGVSCRFCHIPGHWADEDKPHKRIARDMMTMSRAINDSLLSKVYNPDNDRRFVGCNTCHHGHPNPNWESAQPRPQGAPAPSH